LTYQPPAALLHKLILDVNLFEKSELSISRIIYYKIIKKKITVPKVQKNN